LLVAALVGAWLFQGLALHWIEGAWIHDLFGEKGNAPLRVWLAVYYAAVLLVPVGTVTYSASARRAKCTET
jgi:hypothetical protein